MKAYGCAAILFVTVVPCFAQYGPKPTVVVVQPGRQPLPELQFPPVRPYAEAAERAYALRGMLDQQARDRA